jgi:hypothetical protein
LSPQFDPNRADEDASLEVDNSQTTGDSAIGEAPEAQEAREEKLTRGCADLYQ